MFRWDNANATVNRLKYVDGKSTGRSFIWSYSWYLTEVNPSQLTSPDMYWKQYDFNTSYDADIKESDEIIIEDKKYSVQTVLKKKWVALSFTRVILIIDA